MQGSLQGSSRFVSVVSIVLSLFLLVLLSACGDSPKTTQPTHQSISRSTVAQAEAAINSLVANNTFSGVVLAMQDGNVLLHKGYGMADVSQQALNQLNTKFRIGDLTDQFTAMSTLLLQDQQKLQLQDSICAYLSSCPAAWQLVKIQNILTDSSGIPDYQLLGDFVDQRSKPTTLSQIIATVADKPLSYVPGTNGTFSATNYILQGAIIEKVSGESYATFVQQNILDPLGMKNTGYDQNQPNTPEHAVGYQQAQIVATPIDISEVQAAGALYSTVDDLYKWNQALINRKIGSKTSVDAMFASQYPYCGIAGRGDCGGQYQELSLGYAWLVGKESGAGRQVYWYNGAISGFSSWVALYPKENLTVIVLSNIQQATNMSDYAAADAGDGIVGALLPQSN